MLIISALSKHAKKKESHLMDSSENKGRDKATYLNCFCRSLMFWRVATLPGIDSGSLFLEALSVSSLVHFIIFVIMLYNLDWLSSLTLILLVFYVFVAALEYTLFILLFAFIFNLFLADKFMRVVNIFVFSGSPGMFICTVLLSLVTYKVHVHSVETTVQPKPARANIGDIINEVTLMLHGKGSDITRVGRSVVILLLFFTVLYVAFFILLVKNIRALRRR